MELEKKHAYDQGLVAFFISGRGNAASQHL